MQTHYIWGAPESSAYPHKDYSGPVCLEVHGKDEGLGLAALSVIAAESYGFLNACFRLLGVR